MNEGITISTAVDAVNQISKAEHGIHALSIYDDLPGLREFYSYYTKKMIEEKNETVILIPNYETTSQVRQILSEDSSCLEVSKYEKDNSLAIIDSVKVYFGQQKPMDFFNQIVDHLKDKGKHGVSLLADVGCFFNKTRFNGVVDYELSLPKQYHPTMKGFCIYHQKDFDRLTEEQKQKLNEHHTTRIKLECFTD